MLPEEFFHLFYISRLFFIVKWSVNSIWSIVCILSLCWHNKLKDIRVEERIRHAYGAPLNGGPGLRVFNSCFVASRIAHSVRIDSKLSRMLQYAKMGPPFSGALYIILVSVREREAACGMWYQQMSPTGVRHVRRSSFRNFVIRRNPLKNWLQYRDSVIS